MLYVTTELAENPFVFVLTVYEYTAYRFLHTFLCIGI